MSSGTRDLPVFPLSPEPVRPGVGSDAREARHLFRSAGPEGATTVGLVTLGCDKNTVDSERVLATLLGQGLRVTPDPNEAEVVVVNTCGFIQAAKEQSIETLLEACRLKDAGTVRAVVAVGCLVQRYKQELAAEIPEVDLFLGLAEMAELVPELKRLGLLRHADRPAALMERPLRVLTTSTPHTSFLKISEGCDHTCAFCAIPLMRGLHRSAPVEALVAEAQALEAAGVRELNIVSQDTTWYGRDRRRLDAEAPLLPGLLQALLRETEVPWFRLFYMYPSGVTRDLVELLAREDRLVPYLDLPVQHGSDRILAAMRRPERRSTIIERVRWLRDAIPDLTLRTTVIVGFPGETDEDVRALVDLLEEVRFDRVGAFAYSVEEGTRAAEMSGQIPEPLKKERLEAVADVARSLAAEANLDRVGTATRALVDAPAADEPGFEWVARTHGQAIDVDGVTYLEAGRADALYPGAILDVRIVDALEHDLIARPVA